MAARTKEELLAYTEKEFSKLQKLLDDVSEETALKKREDATSLMASVGHRARWNEFFLNWRRNGKKYRHGD